MARQIIINIFNEEQADKAIEEIISTLDYENISYDIESKEV